MVLIVREVQNVTELLRVQETFIAPYWDLKGPDGFFRIIMKPQENVYIPRILIVQTRPILNNPQGHLWPQKLSGIIGPLKTAQGLLQKP